MAMASSDNINNNTNNNNTNNNTNNNNPGNPKARRVLRFEFADALIAHVSAFSNLHQYDDRKTYKEAWAQWLANNEIAALIRTEIARLSDLGYKGDVLDKLFKSGRYYFRQKTRAEPLGVRAATSAPRKYVLLNHALLDAMDDHIERGLRSTDAYTPAGGFADFCNLHADDAVLKAEAASLSDRLSSSQAVHAKLKKTYKNRYFMLMHKAQA